VYAVRQKSILPQQVKSLSTCTPIPNGTGRLNGNILNLSPCFPSKLTRITSFLIGFSLFLMGEASVPMGTRAFPLGFVPVPMGKLVIPTGIALIPVILKAFIGDIF